SELTASDLSKYKLHEMTKDLEVPSPLLWNMPEVFRKKVTAYSGSYLHEVTEQNRLTTLLRYNFSDGTQVSAKDILRHPLQRAVDKDLLPQASSQTSAFSHWPLTQQREHLFLSQNLREIETIMQVLLGNVAAQAGQGKLKLFLQTKNSLRQALQIHRVEFDPGTELSWRVEFIEKKELEAEFKLMSSRKKPFFFFESFAVEPTEGILIAHPWLREFQQLRELLTKSSDSYQDLISLSTEGRPTVNVFGEMELKSALKYLRTRAIPVRIIGDSVTLGPGQSQTQIHLDEAGGFYVLHDARINGQKNLSRKGWTPRSALFLKTLSEGLPYLLNLDAKDLATRSRGKRDWDIKILKHLGVLQYIAFETLSYHFDGALTDGSTPDKEEIFNSLQERIQALLLSGSGVVLAKDYTLPELCSAPVLNYFNDFVKSTFKTFKAKESFYSEQGEVILEGVVERELRLIYEMLKRMAQTSGGEIFKKSRTSLLSKIWSGDIVADPYLKDGRFFFSKGKKEGSLVYETLENVQPLIPHGFSLYFKEQPLQELAEDEFQVEFVLQADGEQRDFNWFELNPKFFLHGQEIDPQNMGSFGGSGVIEYDGRLYLVPRTKMPSLRRLENFWNKLQRGKVEASKRTKGDKVYQLPRNQVLELLALRASGVGIRGDEQWKKLCAFYDSMGESQRAAEVPTTVKADLKPYQVKGFHWLQDLYNLHLGALLADDMGLGKTLQTITFLEDLRVKEELGKVLIIVPSSLIFNWQSEV
ncbi:MAG TPA: SNF2-related protein, partial [Bdellovibrio sp.]